VDEHDRRTVADRLVGEHVAVPDRDRLHGRTITCEAAAMRDGLFRCEKPHVAPALHNKGAMLTRKQFLRDAVGFAAAAFGLTVLGACGGSNPPAPDARSDASGGTGTGGGSGTGSGSGSGSGSGTASRCEMSGTTSTIGTNHGHVLVVSADEVAAGAAKTYHIRGTSDHDHTVELTADEFAALQGNHAIMTVSSYDAGHTHTIMVACA